MSACVLGHSQEAHKIITFFEPGEQSAETQQFRQQSSDSVPWSVPTIFGTLEVVQEKILHFPEGLVGFEDVHFFALFRPTPVNLGDFIFFQSIDMPDLSFFVIPSMLASNPLMKKDYEQPCRELHILPQHLLCLFLTSSYKGEKSTRITLNIKAPLLIDTCHKKGYQYIFSQAYPLEHPYGVAGDSVFRV